MDSLSYFVTSPNAIWNFYVNNSFSRESYWLVPQGGKQNLISHMYAYL